MIAVHPKENCPHVGEHVDASVATNLNVSKPCFQCQGTVENWICCKCGEIGCSRFQQSHMSQHNTTTKHEIAASFSDFSFWCYACESYIKHPSLTSILDAMRRSKFPEPVGSEAQDKPKEDKEASSVTESMAKMNIQPSSSEKPLPPIPTILNSLDVEGIAEYIKSGKATRIIVMTGAGVSVAAGIPDFRTPGTGLYYNLAKYNLPTPTAVFDIDYFVEKPEAFYMLAKELYPGNFGPTHVHYFIRMLHEKGLLLRNYTQNIDTLERIAKIPPEALVEAHGSFGTAHCVDCKAEFDSNYVKDAVFADEIPRCAACSGLVKPDIVFFGEGLPARFFELAQDDFPLCDLLIVIGTSLQVQPFASLIKKVSATTPRLLINMEEVGTASIMDIIMPSISRGFTFNHTNNIRDVKLLGECQAGVKRLAELLGWAQELDDLYERETKEVLATAPNKATATSSMKANTEPFRTPDAPTTTNITTNITTTTTTSEPSPSDSTQSTTAPDPSTTEPEALQSTTGPVQSTAEPAQAAITHTQSGPSPAHATNEPAQATAAPAHATIKPDQATEPSQSTSEPVQSTTEPTQSKATNEAAPVQSTTQPVLSTAQPTEQHKA